MSDRKRPAVHSDTPRPKKSRSENVDSSASTAVPLSHALLPRRKLSGKPNLLEKLATAATVASPSLSIDSTSSGKKGNRWSESEDEILSDAIKEVQIKNPELVGSGIWIQVSKTLGTQRSAKQCRDWTEDEEKEIHKFYQMYGPRWTSMAKVMPGRTDNDIKNKWNATKRSQQRARARLPSDVSSLATETESLESLEQCQESAVPKQLASTPQAVGSTTLCDQEDEKSVTEV